MSVTEATSLWNGNDELFRDNKANQVGDILTVIITEDATATQQASTDASQNNQADVGAGTGIFDFIRSFGFSQSDSSNATGSTSRSGSLSAEITVQIEEELANGNLKISGTRSVKINDETQDIKLTGIVRPEDISPQNTIESNYIANAEIDYEGKGVIGDRQRQGIISRIVAWLF
ncbi:flagellar basal body L-ring protein FlgH [Natroniella acetigena]|uniref:flagellar basal body L-ring protein FlgH n=1 Tax=Natroniella acetigena TaxID=52004 RepID=UPI00200A2240|nr:flagellar basal body L-ring protein FlgH [Natroniella acetigena]